jgi:DNA-binding NarL/FixJ family response regulator
VRAVLEEGACGYLAKESSWKEVLAAVLAVAGGSTEVSPQLQAGLHGQLAKSRRAPSVRELEVLRHASRGLTDAQIAARMYISRETVRTNLKRSSEKLGVSGRTALVATALREDLIE